MNFIYEGTIFLSRNIINNFCFLSMKSLKNILFLILSMLVFSTSIAQTCLFNDLVDDLVQQNSSFQAFVESEKGFRAWKILATEAPSLRTDMQELTLVLNNLEFIEKIGSKNYKSWKLLRDNIDNLNAPNALFRNVEAVETLTKARNNPILKKLGFTDEILASLRASGKGEFSYEKILDKLLSIAKKIEDNPNTTLEDFYEKVIYKLNKNSKATNSQRIGVEGVLKAVDDEFDNLLKGKIVRFENSVENIRGTKSYEDLNVEIVTFDGTKTAYRIEVKNCPTCVDTNIIREQFIERDLFNATDISQIKWRIYGQNFTKQHFEKFLKENKEAIKSLLKNEKSKSNIEKWFDLKEGQSFISDEQIKIFSNTYYSKIFN